MREREREWYGRKSQMNFHISHSRIGPFTENERLLNNFHFLFIITINLNGQLCVRRLLYYIYFSCFSFNKLYLLRLWLYDFITIYVQYKVLLTSGDTVSAFAECLARYSLCQHKQSNMKSLSCTKLLIDLGLSSPAPLPLPSLYVSRFENVCCIRTETESKNKEQLPMIVKRKKRSCTICTTTMATKTKIRNATSETIERWIYCDSTPSLLSRTIFIRRMVMALNAH